MSLNLNITEEISKCIQTHNEKENAHGNMSSKYSPEDHGHDDIVERMDGIIDMLSAKNNDNKESEDEIIESLEDHQGRLGFGSGSTHDKYADKAYLQNYFDEHREELKQLVMDNYADEHWSYGNHGHCEHDSTIQEDYYKYANELSANKKDLKIEEAISAFFAILYGKDPEDPSETIFFPDRIERYNILFNSLSTSVDELIADIEEEPYSSLELSVSEADEVWKKFSNEFAAQDKEKILHTFAKYNIYIPIQS